MAVSLRIPDPLKRRIASLAEARETTPHALMLEAIREKLESEETKAELHAEAQRRLARMKKTRAAIPATEVFRYLEARARGKAAARPRPRRIA
jgi:predicted DNA-binding protein